MKDIIYEGNGALIYCVLKRINDATPQPIDPKDTFVPNLLKAFSHWRLSLNSDGTLDTTFTFELLAIVYTTSLLSSGILIVGGRFSSPMDRMLELFIGEEYELRSFDTCDGSSSNIFLPTNTEISTVLDLIYDGDYDDSNFFIELPLDFDINFLGTNYTSVYIVSNSYLTFGEGSNKYDFSIRKDTLKILLISLLIGIAACTITFTIDYPYAYYPLGLILVFSMLYSYKELNNRVAIYSYLIKIKNKFKRNE